MRKTTWLSLPKTSVLKNTDLEHYFDEEYQDVLKNQFWRYEFEWKKVENYTLKKL